MKLITLNTWGGRITKDLLAFLEKQRESTDVFCFQEIFHRANHALGAQGNLDPDLTLFDDITKVLPDHQGYFRSQYLETYGIATFVNKTINITDEGDFFVHHYKDYDPGELINDHARSVQRISIKQDTQDLHIFNFHGLWNGNGKGDSEARLEQSKKLTEYIKNYEGKKILCGDFNLSPDTNSLKMIEDIPLKNLVKEYDVTSTRTSYYEKENRFADYILVNEKIQVLNFEVLPDEVSDHSPLIIEFK